MSTEDPHMKSWKVFTISVKAWRPSILFAASRPTMTTTYARPTISIEEH